MGHWGTALVMPAVCVVVTASHLEGQTSKFRNVNLWKK